MVVRGGGGGFKAYFQYLCKYDKFEMIHHAGLKL